MASKLADTVKNLLDGMHAISQTETIVGEPAKVGDATIVPVHRLRVGFVAAGVSAGGHTNASEGKTGGQGVGGTVQLDPVAVLAFGKDGTPRLLSVEGDSKTTWQTLLQEAPEIAAKLVGKLSERVEELTLGRASAAAAPPVAVEAHAKLPEKT
jgi:uncharacterized spore protein YtfJ